MRIYWCIVAGAALIVLLRLRSNWKRHGRELALCLLEHDAGEFGLVLIPLLWFGLILIFIFFLRLFAATSR